MLTCGGCAGEELELLFTAADFDTGTREFQIMRCARCALAQTAPRLSPAELADHYRGDYYGHADRKFSGLLEQLTVAADRQRARAILGTHRASAKAGQSRPRVLDVGCGRGNLLRALAALGCECHGVERADFPAGREVAGVAFHYQELEAVGFEEGYFDIAILWHVLEHLGDPGATLREIGRILASGGLLVVAVPNFASVQSRWFGADWFHLDLPRHLFHFSQPSLEDLLSATGFRVQRRSTFSPGQDLFGFCQSLFNRCTPRSLANRMYRLMRPGRAAARTLELSGWALLTAMVMPLAVAALVLGQLRGAGASLIVYSRRT